MLLVFSMSGDLRPPVLGAAAAPGAGRCLGRRGYQAV
jgi:hypothetical protein